MWCDRCGEEDRAMLGTDEHVHSQWLILCEGCIRELDEDVAADALAVQEYALRRTPAGSAPVTRSRWLSRRLGAA